MDIASQAPDPRERLPLRPPPEAPPFLETAGQVDPREDFLHSVDRGLAQSPQSLECRFLYDAEGTRLFEAICEQPEYYPTRTEASILARCAPRIRELAGSSTLLELGSGLSIKTRYLLDAWTERAPDMRYVPVDVSEAALRLARSSLLSAYPGLQFVGVHGTYEQAFPLLRDLSPVVVAFLGSTIGNFTPAEMSAFLSGLSLAMRPGDHFLLGVDLVKDPAILEAAYNDAAGVTASFTLNLFARINRELGSTIALEALEHQARWNPQLEQIEIDVLVHRDQPVNMPGLGPVHFLRAGTRIRVEISRKFQLEALEKRLATHGWALEEAFTDEKQWFAILLLRRTDLPDLTTGEEL